jgi:threonine/homoserine efflux transporter RhtA
MGRIQEKRGSARAAPPTVCTPLEFDDGTDAYSANLSRTAKDIGWIVLILFAAGFIVLILSSIGVIDLTDDD